MREKLTLCPERLAAVGFNEAPAQILNRFGDPVLAAWE
jgi:hypothetical protein